MTIIKMLHDDYGNTAVIEKGLTLPYAEAAKKVMSYRLSLYATYDNNFLYHVSTYDLLSDLEANLKSFSCGTFK